MAGIMPRLSMRASRAPAWGTMNDSSATQAGDDVSDQNIPLLRGALRALKIILLTFTGIGRARMIQTTTEGLGPQHFLLGGLFAAILVNLVLGTLVWLAVR
jgi:hypothetical protein